MDRTFLIQSLIKKIPTCCFPTFKGSHLSFQCLTPKGVKSCTPHLSQNMLSIDFSDPPFLPTRRLFCQFLRLMQPRNFSCRMPQMAPREEEMANELAPFPCQQHRLLPGYGMKTFREERKEPSRKGNRFLFKHLFSFTFSLSTKAPL